MPEIIPAILTNDLEDLKLKLKKLEGLTRWVQIDVMDGRFVNNTSLKLEELVGIDHKFNLEVHLMVEEPQNYFAICSQLGAKRVFFHYEATQNVDEVLKMSEQYDFKTGISINPPTLLDSITSYLNKVDVVLFLAVNPGWQGQQFDETVLKKIKKLKKISPQTKIAIDGGVNLENVKQVVEAGVDLINVGSVIVKSDNFSEAITQFKETIK